MAFICTNIIKAPRDVHTHLSHAPWHGPSGMKRFKNKYLFK